MALSLFVWYELSFGNTRCSFCCNVYRYVVRRGSTITVETWRLEMQISPTVYKAQVSIAAKYAPLIQRGEVPS